MLSDSYRSVLIGQKLVENAKIEDILGDFLTLCTVFENHRKSLIQHCERSGFGLQFEWTKVNQKCQNGSVLENLYFAVKQRYQIGQF